MAFHVPFNQRASARRNPQPIYIGFDIPTEVPVEVVRPKFNWWGFNGMWLSFASLLSAGFLSPVPLLISLVGLRRPGKKMATVGTFTSMAGIVLATTLVLGSIVAHKQHKERRAAAHYRQVVSEQIHDTEMMLVIAGEEITTYRDENKGKLPSDMDGNLLVIKHIDPWGQSLRFEIDKDHGIIRSAGPDGRFNNRDDVSVRIDGQPVDTAPLLPMD